MDADAIAALEREVEHARAIAACSIGQPDRAENVAYREAMEAKLRAAREAAEWMPPPCPALNLDHWSGGKDRT